jgi:hypothetical protein
MSATAYLVGRQEAKLALSLTDPTTRADSLYAAERIDGLPVKGVNFEHCTFANISFKSCVIEEARFVDCVFYRMLLQISSYTELHD